MKSTLVLTLKDSGSSCTFAVIGGVVHQIISGGIDAAQVLRKANAVLDCSAEQMASECTRAFNSSNDGEYVATLVETIDAQIIEAGNGLPYVGDLVYSGETNMVYRLVTCSRVQTNNNGKGNSMDVTLIEAGSPDDYTETAFADILECQVDID